MAVNKVIYGGNTLIDISSDTVTAETLAQGVTAHGADGKLITGTMAPGGSDTVIWDGDMSGKAWFLLFDEDFSTLYVRVSDAIPTFEDFKNGYSCKAVFYSGELIEAEVTNFEADTLYTNDDGVIGGENLWFIAAPRPAVEIVEGGNLPPLEGLYLLYSPVESAYISSLTINGYTGF